MDVNPVAGFYEKILLGMFLYIHRIGFDYFPIACDRYVFFVGVLGITAGRGNGL